MEEQVQALKDTLTAAKKVIDEKIEESRKSVQTALESHREGVNQKTLLDTCSDWIAIVKEDAFEKGRKTGYAEACEHFSPLMDQDKSMIDQFDVIANKSLNSIENGLKASIDKLSEAGESIQKRAREIEELKSKIAGLESENRSLEKKAQSLEKKIAEMPTHSEEEKPKRGRPKKKKSSDPLE